MLVLLFQLKERIAKKIKIRATVGVVETRDSVSSIDEASEDTNKKDLSDENKVVDIKKPESSGETNQNGSNVMRDNDNKQNDT